MTFIIGNLAIIINKKLASSLVMNWTYNSLWGDIEPHTNWNWANYSFFMYDASSWLFDGPTSLICKLDLIVFFVYFNIIVSEKYLHHCCWSIFNKLNLIMDQTKLMLVMGGMFEKVEETTNMVNTSHCCQMSTRNVYLVFMINTFLTPFLLLQLWLQLFFSQQQQKH